jgi:carboxyl-terminal processing protease
VQIKAADYAPVGDLHSLVPTLSTLHDARVKADKDFQYLQEDIAELQRQRAKNMISLNEAERRKERDAQEARQAAREARADAQPDLSRQDQRQAPKVTESQSQRDDGLQANERNLGKELAAEKARKDAKDVLLLEAVQILGDEIDVLKTGVALATRAKPETVLLPN